MSSPEFHIPRADAQPITTVRHGGIELPLYDDTDVAWTRTQLERAAKAGRANVVRHIRLNGNTHFKLADLLDATEMVFDEVAAATHSRVVEHTWGLAVAPDYVQRDFGSHYMTYHSPHLPGMTSLVAKVAIVPHARPVFDKFNDLQRGLRDYASGAITSPYVWYDDKPQNFVQDEQGATYLVDIEPVIMRSADRRLPSGTPLYIGAAS